MSKINNSFDTNNIERLKMKVMSGETLDIKWRLEQINKINFILDKYKEEIVDCLNLDLGKSKIEALAEIILIKEEIILVKNNLRYWMKPKNIKTPLYLFPSFSKVIFEPLGCVLILGPYNYPLLYLLKPLINIFSAGNTAVLKPSEKCPNISKLIKELTIKYFDKDILITIEGNYKVAGKLTNLNFDHIFFTGGTKTGKSIMKSAAKNLIPITLELSGTNPVIVLKNANIKIAARRIVWGKFFNSGQSCVAPNHIFVEKIIAEELIKELKNAIIDFYGSNPIKSPNISKLEKDQFSRTLRTLKKLIATEKIIYGGNYDKKQSKISPTIIKLKSDKDSLLKCEVFSSLLPLLTIDNLQSVLEIIQKSPKPLSIYMFGGNSRDHKQLSNMTSSGSVCLNDVMLPVLIPNLPFGGVGLSGIGRFHGETGFKNFSNQKSITYKSNFLDVKLRYPPYDRVLKFIKIFFKI